MKIDAHIHFVDDSPGALQILEDYDVSVLNICVANRSRPWREIEHAPYQRMARERPQRYAWCTTFDLPGFDDPDYADRVIAGLEQDFKAGAVACKVWKNVGMELKRPDGSFCMVDDPIFDPIFSYLAREGKPLLAHIGEPLACWRPLVEGMPHCEYYKRNPQWHMHGRDDMPSHETIIAARDRMLEKHPDLKVIGAHLGSVEYDVDEIARRLEKYPNFAVDVSARAGDLMVQETPKVRQLFLDYPDRILFGTDIVHRTPEKFSPEELERKYQSYRRWYDRYFTYFETDEPMEVGGRPLKGLALPEDVLQKFYIDNARTWYPELRF